MGEGNERFRGLLEPVYAQALAFARHISSSSSDGDDLFQDALIRALGKLDRLRDEAAFKPWLYRIVIVEHVVVAPLGVAFGMLNLVLYLTVHMHQGPDDGASYGALAMAGVLVAFTSMMLRRLRRSVIASR